MEVLPTDLRDAYQEVYNRLTPGEQEAWAATATALGLNVDGNEGPGNTPEMDLTKAPTVAQIATLLGLDPATATKESIAAFLLEKGVTLPENFWDTPLSANEAILTQIQAVAAGEDPAKAGTPYSAEEAKEIIDLLYNPEADTPEEIAANGERLIELGFPVTDWQKAPPLSTIASLAGMSDFADYKPGPNNEPPKKTEADLRAALEAKGIDLPDDFFKGPIDAADMAFLDKIIASNTTTAQPTET
jgi:hypothetical protein